jgi:hypothetical protein
MQLNFAAGDGGERRGGQAGDLAQKFFQGFFVIGGDAFRGDGFSGDGCSGGLGFAKKLLGKTGAGGDR